MKMMFDVSDVRTPGVELGSVTLHVEYTVEEILALAKAYPETVKLVLQAMQKK